MEKKQKIRFLMWLACIGLLLWSCEPTAEEPAPPGNNNTPDPTGSSNIEGCQYPAVDMLAATNSTIDVGSFKSVNGNPNVYQVFGYSFVVEYDGVIKELGIQVPEPGEYTVRVYHKDPLDEEILAEAQIDVVDDQWTYVSIDPLSVEASEEYMTAIYFKSKVEGLETFFYSVSNFQYPQQYGDVILEGYAVNSEVGEKVKPLAQDSDQPTLFNGFVDFCFEAN